MSAKNVLIVGGGPAGMATAMSLRARGIDSVVAERNPEWAAAGIGLTLLGPTLRALQTVGLLEAAVGAGYGMEVLEVFGADGTQTGAVEFPQINDPRYPAAVGVTRPAFHRVLADATLAAGIDVRRGVTVESLQDDGAGVDVRLTDGSTGRFDLVVGADGLHSSIRALVFDEVIKPAYTGQAVWRALIRRPPELRRYRMVYGRKAKFGLVPVSEEHLYVFIVENVPERARPPRDQLENLMRALLDADDEWAAYVRDQIREPGQADYRPLETMLVPPPWNRGRVVLVGDSAHTTTPHLAFGAGIAIEDGVVLAELLAESPSVEVAFARYVERRYERCRLVVNNSVQLGRWEQEPTPDADPVRLTRESWATLSQAP